MIAKSSLFFDPRAVAVSESTQRKGGFCWEWGRSVTFFLKLGKSQRAGKLRDEKKGGDQENECSFRQSYLECQQQMFVISLGMKAQGNPWFSAVHSGFT